MTNYFIKFLQVNKKIVFDKKKTKGYALIIDRKRYVSAIYSSLAAAAVCNKYNLKPAVITDDLKSDFKKLYESFGIKKFFIGFSYYSLLNDIFIFLNSLFLFLNIIPKIKIKGFEWFIREFKVKNIDIGDLIYDSYVRKGRRYINPKVDTYFLNILFKSIYRTLKIHKIISELSPEFIFVSTSTYAGNDGIALRIGLEKKIKVIEPGPYSFYKYDKRNIKFGKYNLFSQGKKKEVLNEKISINKINLFLKNRFKGTLKTVQTAPRDLKIANQNKLLFNRSKLLKKLNLSNSKIDKIILFAPHCFSDSPHGNGTFFIFRDYYQQFVETLRFIDKKNLPNILWLIRPHPSSEWFEEEGSVEQLMLKYSNNKLIKLCRVNFANTSNLVEICDHVITGRGNIGLEFACNGKYPILAGTASYTGLDFTLESKNKKEYFKKLLNIKKFEKISIKKTLDAKKATYFLENNLFNILKTSKILNEEIFREGTKAGKRGDDFIFCNKLIKRLKNKSFDQDLYYKDLLKKL
jgi:hypothetical protein